MFSKAAVWLVIALVLFTVFKQFDKPRVQEGVSYSQFMDDAKNGKVKNVIVQGRNLTVTPADGQKYQIVSPGDIWMVGDLMKYGVQVSGKADEEPNALVSALYYLGPTILIIGFWFYMMRQMQGGGKGGAFSFGKSRARLIDEIDAVGRHRGAGMGGGNDEREQTLNQMLVEMDGFEANSGVIVIAATNRSDVLDKALLRPGRFDRQVYVGLPDIRGREQILKVHMRKVPIGNDVDASVIAR